MILYHGSNVKVKDIDLSKCRPNKDFGRGFYLTDDYTGATKMAQRVVRIYGGSPHVSSFSFDETVLSTDMLNVLLFDKPERDWALFVINNRNKRFNNIGDRLCNQDNKYDIVTGPIANDDIASLFRLFSGGIIDIDALCKGLEYKVLTIQYSFHTVDALKYLQPTEDK